MDTPLGHREIDALTLAALFEYGRSMSVDGRVVSTGTGSACLDDPLHALGWLARTAREFGESRCAQGSWCCPVR